MSAVDILPHVNGGLNALATLLLLLGYVLIRRRQEVAHRRVMLSAFGVSTLFLACYLVYHSLSEPRSFSFEAPAWVRQFYYVILVTHITLAALVPFLAGITIYRGWRDQRESHRRWAKWTFPIWLYVSVTGLAIYVMLYQLYPVG